MVQKITEEYANHGMSLKCDIYTDDNYPKDTPVFLYFHPGGLVDGNRDLIAPWLVQVSWSVKTSNKTWGKHVQTDMISDSNKTNASIIGVHPA